jgi:hypothetical protein
MKKICTFRGKKKVKLSPQNPKNGISALKFSALKRKKYVGQTHKVQAYFSELSINFPYFFFSF